MAPTRTALIDSPSEAARLLNAGGLVAFPTETVFGLGVDATSDEAVRRLFAAKGRPSDNPLIVHVAEIDQWRLAASALTPSAAALLAAFAPGPLTVVLPKRPEISSLVTAGLGTVGVRVPDHPVAREVLRLAGAPIAAPSANRSGRPSGTRWRSVLEDLDGRIDAVYRQDGPSLGLESTVVDCTGSVAAVLRPGAVTTEQIRRVLPDARESFGAPSSGAPTSGAHEAVRSPGVAHPHYQPRAEVRLVDAPESLTLGGSERAAYCGLQAVDRLRGSFELYAVYPTPDEYAAAFYEFLREADRRGVARVYVQLAPDEGIGRALRDRQLRAAGER
ncbi:L-threonylcarbamoyladenylate synthase [Botrimarina sp.]|uniref:L-threonylcarbamoyladenylate synthase n=1 Tax=Botrimarina sp. TaxID=2795802 RepID=UPI0032EF23E4